MKKLNHLYGKIHIESHIEMYITQIEVQEEHIPRGYGSSSSKSCKYLLFEPTYLRNCGRVDDA